MAITNPFAQINAQLPPLAPPPPEFNVMPDGPAPQMSSGTHPKVEQAPKASVFAPIQQREEQMLGNRLEGDYQKDLHPWGTPENHPGVWGKIGHAVSVATGGPNRRMMEEQGLEKRVNDLETGMGENAYRGAETSKTEQDTAMAPNKTASEEALQTAQTGNLESETRDRDMNAAQGPALATAYAHAVNMAIKNGVDPSKDPIVQQLSDAITSVQKQPAAKGMEKVDVVGPGGKPMVGNYNPQTGKVTDATGKEIPNAQPYEKPNQAGMVTMIAPDPNTPGGGIVQRLGAGAHVAPGSQTAAGVNSMNTPTTTQRTAAGRADTVLSMVPEVMGRIDATGPQMGPEMGRWNDFMQGKVGTNNPEFAALRSDLLMMSSAVALAHAQGRLPENLREEFDRAINAPKQTPENLKATINAMVPWLEKVKTQGSAPNGAQEGGQMIRAVDPQGVLHEAPAGTPLPAGWKAQ